MLLKRISILVCIWVCCCFSASAQSVVAIHVNGSINPASAEFIENSIAQATEKRAECLVIHLNTPGGLLKSTRDIVGNILKSGVPVVVYISPSGAQAGSAGVFITTAAHIAAMAPGTNIGAAHPVNMQGASDSIMNSKVTNDAVAFIRSIAATRNRNIRWAEDAVRNSVSITESEAVANDVVNLVADNEQQLLQKINGMKVQVEGGEHVLRTSGAKVQVVEMTWVSKLLNIISDPNIAYILMMLGFYGIMFELFNPGLILPGIVGVISLILAFYSMQTLPINYAGVGLIIFSIILFLLEIKITSHGILAIGGVISLLLGSLILVRKAPGFEFIQISKSLIIATTIITALFFLFIIGMGLRAQKLKPVTGVEGMIGETGEAISMLDPKGRVRFRGEEWNARSIAGPVNIDGKVRVVRIENLTLLVEPLNHDNLLT